MKLNKATRKDHFPQMLESLASHQYYCFLDGYFGYNQIVIPPEDQEKTKFTCPYGTFTFHCKPFGLFNALSIFQRCMIAIFMYLVEDLMEIFMDDFSICGSFMDDFSVFGSYFDHCLNNLGLVQKRCEENQLVLNWEKCHFIVKEGIVLGYRVSQEGLEVDHAKISIIEHL